MDAVRDQLVVLAGVALACLWGGGCERAPAARAATPTHVDSVRPRAVELAEFRAALEEPQGLAGGAASRHALVQRFLRALERRDTATLRALLLTRAEFAYLYYPTNPEALPPYDLAPGLMWFMLEGNSRRGLAHALEERGGRPLGAAGYICEGTPSRQGANTVWTACVVRRLQAPGDTVAERLFGPIVARAGRFKFVSYANKL